MALILASASTIRAEMLGAAGIAFEIQPAELDEARIKAAHRGDAAELAINLASAKATAISALRPGDWVIGSDSLVAVSGRMFAKPRDRSEAAEHLRMFSGQPMILTSAVAVARDGDGAGQDHRLP